MKPSHSGEHCNYSDAQIVAAGKPFDEEGFKQILSEDALKAWNSGTKALIHPRSGEKALKAFKEIGTKISKKERDVSFGSKSTIESLKSFDSGHHRPEQHAQSSRSQAGGTPNKTNALYMTDPATGKHYLVGQAPVPSTPQQFVRNDVGSPLMVPENGSLYQSAASIMQQPHFAANTTLMDPRNIPGLFGRMPVTHSPSVRPDPYSQAQLYGPTFHTPHILPGTQITPQIGWMTGVISVGPNGLPVAGPPPNADAVMRARLSAGSIMPTQSGNGYLSPYNVEVFEVSWIYLLRNLLICVQELHREANRIALRVEEEKIRNTRRF